MKRIIFIFLYFSIINITNAQRESDAMYFGGCFGGGCWCNTPNQGNIYQFNQDSLVQIIDPACLPLTTFYSAATFADRNTGELLFACNGWRLINGDGQILSHKLWFDDMPHPQDSPDTSTVNVTAGPLFLPHPSDSTKAYLFYGQFLHYTLQNFTFVADKFITYALLDIPTKTLISRNNIVLSDTSSISDMQACRHANGRDWWIIKPDIWTNKFFVGLLTPQGIEMNPITIPGAPTDLRVNTSSKFNIQGTKYIHYSGGISRTIHEYNFDRCSGTLSNLVIHDISDSISPTDNTLATMTISPDGSKFYLKTNSSFSYNIRGGFSQIDLSTDSIKLISFRGQCPQMMPNGKKLLFGNNFRDSNNVIQRRVGEISNPNAPFNELVIDYFKYDTPNALLTIAPNNFAYMRLGADTLSICDSLSVITRKSANKEPSGLVVFPNPATNQLNLVFDKNSTGTITISDALGKVVYSYIINNNSLELTIDISSFNSGIYYLSYRNKDVSIHKKFIKQ
jgi:hypothetical protein